MKENNVVLKILVTEHNTKYISYCIPQQDFKIIPRHVRVKHLKDQEHEILMLQHQGSAIIVPEALFLLSDPEKDQMPATLTTTGSELGNIYYRSLIHDCCIALHQHYILKNNIVKDNENVFYIEGDDPYRLKLKFKIVDDTVLIMQVVEQEQFTQFHQFIIPSNVPRLRCEDYLSSHIQIWHTPENFNPEKKTSWAFETTSDLHLFINKVYEWFNITEEGRSSSPVVRKYLLNEFNDEYPKVYTTTIYNNSNSVNMKMSNSNEGMDVL